MDLLLALKKDAGLRSRSTEGSIFFLLISFRRPPLLYEGAQPSEQGLAADLIGPFTVQVAATPLKQPKAHLGVSHACETGENMQVRAT